MLLLEGKEFGFRKRLNDGSLARTVLHRGSTPSFSDGSRNARFYWGFRTALADGGEGGTPTPAPRRL